jgi:hypothetical protein
MLRIPQILDKRLIDGGEVVSYMRRSRFTSQKDFLVLISEYILRS